MKTLLLLLYKNSMGIIIRDQEFQNMLQMLSLYIHKSFKYITVIQIFRFRNILL